MTTSSVVHVLPVLLLVGCSSTTPRSHWETLFEKSLAEGIGFQHVVFSRDLQPNARTIHVYIGGDGQAFITKDRVARDPTSRKSLTLELMQADANPAVYVGRPCYHGLAESQPCEPRYWTIERYSEAVVDSMAHVIGNLIAAHPDAEVTVFGYSGGGVLALLASRNLARVSLIVTVAAPLDTDAWTHMHQYTPLYGSINPSTVTNWPPNQQQIHLIGGRDHNVSEASITNFRERFESEQIRFEVLDSLDHDCCWVSLWPSLLQTVAIRED